MRHVETFCIEEEVKHSQHELCDQINQHANDNNLLIHSISFSHPRRAFVVFEQSMLACEAPEKPPIIITGSTDFIPNPIIDELIVDDQIIISMNDINQRYRDDSADISVEVTTSYGDKNYFGVGNSTAEAIVYLIDRIEEKVGRRVLVNCGLHGKQGASFFMKEHAKLKTD